jgi:hypothetical protein
MDQIFAAAPYASLLALRGTSVAWRDRVDALLSRHLTVNEKGIRSVLGGHPAFHPGNREFNHTTEVVDCLDMEYLTRMPPPGSDV